jgi:tetratricopeptide (TPR) repeat protein
MSESSFDAGRVYRAFISYSHVDELWADWLHKELESWRVPSRLVGTQAAYGVIPRRLAPIFRDRDELASATDLNRTVNAALAKSETLIVICSPDAARSRWVNEEVLAFKRMDREERILCLIVGGEPFASEKPGREAEECFCPALRFMLDASGKPTGERTEPIAADARPGVDSKATAKLRLIAGMLGVGFDTLVQREAHRRHRRMLAITLASILGMAIAAVLSITAYVARNEARQRQAQTEQALNFMLGDLYDKLEGTGRLDLMASVTDKAMALFAASKPGSLSDLELTQQSRALVQIGQIRIGEGRYGAAMEAFEQAERRSSELTARHADNGRFLYDRAQAEFGIGSLYWQQRKLEAANTWLTRYRDSTLALLKLDPRNDRWRLETTYGEHNLAALALDRGDLVAAQRGFGAELATQRALMREQPSNPQLVADVADTISWLGKLAGLRGDLTGAQRLFSEQARQLADLHSRHPEDFRWLYEWAQAQEVLAASLSAIGQQEESSRILAKAIDANRTLTTHDPKNIPWQISLASAQIRNASYVYAAGHTEQAARLLSEPMGRLQNLGPSTPAHNRQAVHVLSSGWLLSARLAWRGGNLQAASDAATRALMESQNETANDTVEADALADQSDALVLLGVLQQAQSPGTRPPAWAQAHELLAARAATSHNWRVLDPWLRLCLLTGDGAHAQIAIDRLNASGYVPLEPWPATAGQPASAATEGDHDHVD